MFQTCSVQLPASRFIWGHLCPAQPGHGSRYPDLPHDVDKIDQAALALLLIGRHEHYSTWKGIDWEVMGRLHQRGLISDPVGKAKSVAFTHAGLREAERLFRSLFSL